MVRSDVECSIDDLAQGKDAASLLQISTLRVFSGFSAQLASKQRKGVVRQFWTPRDDPINCLTSDNTCVTIVLRLTH